MWRYSPAELQLKHSHQLSRITEYLFETRRICSFTKENNIFENIVASVYRTRRVAPSPAYMENVLQSMQEGGVIAQEIADSSPNHDILTLYEQNYSFCSRKITAKTEPRLKITIFNYKDYNTDNYAMSYRMQIILYKTIDSMTQRVHKISE